MPRVTAKLEITVWHSRRSSIGSTGCKSRRLAHDEGLHRRSLWKARQVHGARRVLRLLAQRSPLNGNDDRQMSCRYRLVIAVPSLLFGLFAGCAQVRPTVENDPSFESVELGNHRFHVQTLGDKQLPPVIVVHGGPGGDSTTTCSSRC